LNARRNSEGEWRIGRRRPQRARAGRRLRRGMPGDGRGGRRENLAQRLDGPGDAAEQEARDVCERTMAQCGGARDRGRRCGRQLCRGQALQGVHGRLRKVIGDDAVDTNEDRVDERDKVVEAVRDEGAATLRLDVADAVEDVEQHRVWELVELVLCVVPARPLDRWRKRGRETKRSSGMNENETSVCFGWFEESFAVMIVFNNK
jgi:hypothetical protein